MQGQMELFGIGIDPASGRDRSALAWLSGTKRPEYDPAASLEERFQAFHQANPHVAAAIRVLARQLKAAGQSRGSMALIFERLRWEATVRLGQDEREDFVLNNSYRAFYSRMLNREPEFQGFFETREQRGGE